MKFSCHTNISKNLKIALGFAEVTEMLSTDKVHKYIFPGCGKIYFVGWTIFQLTEDFYSSATVGTSALL